MSSLSDLGPNLCQKGKHNFSFFFVNSPARSFSSIRNAFVRGLVMSVHICVTKLHGNGCLTKQVLRENREGKFREEKEKKCKEEKTDGDQEKRGKVLCIYES